MRVEPLQRNSGSNALAASSDSRNFLSGGSAVFAASAPRCGSVVRKHSTWTTYAPARTVAQSDTLSHT